MKKDKKKSKKKKLISQKFIIIFASACCVSLLITLPFWSEKSGQVLSSTTVDVVVAKDTFHRPNQAQWGTATDGQVWRGAASSNSTFSIYNNTGQEYNANNSTFESTLGPSFTDGEVLIIYAASNYQNNNYAGAILRKIDSDNYYYADTDGIILVIKKKIAGAVTVIGSVPYNPSPNLYYYLRFRIIGSVLFVKIWAAGSSEPSNWNLTASDSSISAGYAGIRTVEQPGSTLSFAFFQAEQTVPAPTNTPSPTPTNTPTPSPSPTPTPTTIPTPTNLPLSSPTAPISQSTPTPTIESLFPSDTSTPPVPITPVTTITPVQANNPLQGVVQFLQNIPNPFGNNLPAPTQPIITPENPKNTNSNNLLYQESQYKPTGIDLNFVHTQNAFQGTKSSFPNPLSFIFSLNDAIRNFFSNLFATGIKKVLH